jgi:hypothetical protein
MNTKYNQRAKIYSIYHMNTKYNQRAIKYTIWPKIKTKGPQNIPYDQKLKPKGHKIFQMAICTYLNYTNIVHFKALQNLPKISFWGWKYTIWQPCIRIEGTTVSLGKQGVRIFSFTNRKKQTFYLSIFFMSKYLKNPLHEIVGMVLEFSCLVSPNIGLILVGNWPDLPQAYKNYLHGIYLQFFDKTNTY